MNDDGIRSRERKCSFAIVRREAKFLVEVIVGVEVICVCELEILQWAAVCFYVMRVSQSGCQSLGQAKWVSGLNPLMAPDTIQVCLRYQKSKKMQPDIRK